MDSKSSRSNTQELDNIIKSSIIMCPICLVRCLASELSDKDIPKVSCLECGHLMHSRCFQDYIGSRVGNKLYLDCPQPENMNDRVVPDDNDNFPCPVCKQCNKIVVGNGVIDPNSTDEQANSIIETLRRHYPPAANVEEAVKAHDEMVTTIKKEMTDRRNAFHLSPHAALEEIEAAEAAKEKRFNTLFGMKVPRKIGRRQARTRPLTVLQQAELRAAERSRLETLSWEESDRARGLAGGKSPIKPTYRKLRKSRRNTLKKRPRKTSRKTLKKKPRKTLKKRSKRRKRSTKRH